MDQAKHVKFRSGENKADRGRGQKMKWKFEETRRPCGFISQWYSAEAGLLSRKQTVNDNKNMIFIHTPYLNSQWAHFTA